MTGKADWQLKIQIDTTGATSGIQDVHSKSEKKPLKTFTGVNATSYKDW